MASLVRTRTQWYVWLQLLAMIACVTADGVYEETNLPKRRLCTGNPRADYCNAQFFNEVRRTFSTDLKLNYTGPAVCSVLNSRNPRGIPWYANPRPNTNVPGTVIRCVLRGTYVNPILNTTEPFRLNFFNVRADNTVAVFAYYGSRNF